MVERLLLVADGSPATEEKQRVEKWYAQAVEQHGRKPQPQQVRRRVLGEELVGDALGAGVLAQLREAQREHVVRHVGREHSSEQCEGESEEAVDTARCGGAQGRGWAV